MLKVFLVEDEFVVREGIKNNIDWKAHGYDFCGEAGDGEVAYSMIQKNQEHSVYLCASDGSHSPDWSVKDQHTSEQACTLGLSGEHSKRAAA